ncbi:MAG: hypothetical protein IPH62_15120 [Ignavibacteriae bacterium]|nr:hypothetical protein [Ignavibacteriota bacterium]
MIKNLDKRLSRLEAKMFLLSENFDRESKIMAMFKFMDEYELELIVSTKDNVELESILDTMLKKYEYALKDFSLTKKEKLEMELLKTLPIYRLKKIANGEKEEIEIFNSRLKELLES